MAFVQNTKSKIKQQLPLNKSTAGCSQGKEDKCCIIGDETGVWCEADQTFKCKRGKSNRTKSKQVKKLTTVFEVNETTRSLETDGPEPEPVKETPHSKKVHLVFLPDKYEPLIEDLGGNLPKESKEDIRYIRKQKVKKCKKNICKALRAGWKYFVIGLQEFSKSYTSIYTTSFTIIPEMR